MLYISKKLIKEEHYNVSTTEKRVYLLKAYAGMDGELINSVCDLGADGLVIEALGAGNLPPKTVPAIRNCIEKKYTCSFRFSCF